MDALLCYEVWTWGRGDRTFRGAYWDVNKAWAKAVSLGMTEDDNDVEVIVANGMQHNVETGEWSKRSDVK